jgi:hypothetical protein
MKKIYTPVVADTFAAIGIIATFYGFLALIALIAA